ncbi:uncharacterized protein LOC112684535 [Sipha flava]|uniref:Uncharacterized protein LOC112684535 n=1 Tax=Sipha flava TaxID=143950 RepID=A0A8B8FMS0_9HEMI|nr:uncharacterized protein LOC112684535 [Sipha flava]
MSNNCIRSVTCVEEDDRCMAQLTKQIEVQGTTINQLLSKISEMKNNFQMQLQLKDNEFSNLREKYEQLQYRVTEFGDNSSKIDQPNFYRHYQNTLDKLIKEIESLKRKNKELLNEKNYLVSKLAEKFKQYPMASFDYGNESYNIISKLTKSEKAENVGTRRCDKFSDLYVTKLDENLAFVGVSDGVVQKASDVIKVQQPQTIENPMKIIGASIDEVSLTKTISSDFKVVSNHLDATKNDTIFTEENCCKMNAKSGGHSDINNIIKLDQIKTFKTTVNDEKKKLIDNKLDARLKSDPICALQELCMYRDWKLPEYKFFKEGDSTTFTYSVECTVLSFTVRVEGLLKKRG